MLLPLLMNLEMAAGVVEAAPPPVTVSGGGFGSKKRKRNYSYAEPEIDYTRQKREDELMLQVIKMFVELNG